MIWKEKCSGCTACEHVCPTVCIKMKEDEEGFLYPSIDKTKCIHCNKCEKVCPIKNMSVENTETKVFVGYNMDDNVRRESSSGGVFSLIAEWILQKNGVVFGAAFDDCFEVHHIVIETRNDLWKLRGSKYVQSRMEDIFPQVKHCLEKKRNVLFSGTACQIAGLQKYLNVESEYLYTIDILCHGVPSPKVWRMYMKEQTKNHKAEIEKIEFRNKENGWKNYSMNILFSNTHRYLVPFYKDKYMRMFLGNIDLRPSCYHCQFKKIPRSSDLTIGDSWGIENVMPHMDDDKGTSVILVHSAKGQYLLNEIKKMLIVQGTNLDQVLAKTVDSRTSVAMHPNRENYLEGIRRGEDFEQLFKYMKKSGFQKLLSYIKYILDRL